MSLFSLAVRLLGQEEISIRRVKSNRQLRKIAEEETIMRTQAQQKQFNVAAKLRQSIWDCTLLLLISLAWIQPIQAQEARFQAALPAKEAVEVSFDSKAVEEKAAVIKLLVQKRDGQNLSSQLAQFQPSLGSFNSWRPLPVWLIAPTTSQTGASKKNKKAGLLVGVMGLGLAGAGGYLIATSVKTIESCVPIGNPFSPCQRVPSFDRVETNHGKFYGGIGLTVAGGVLVIFGFRNLR
jgi:hypothetical protein